MNNRKQAVCSSIMILFIFYITVFADNPIFQHVFTADPAPMVYKDTVFCYTSHDEDVLVDNFFTMRDWCCYSTTDMVNWRFRGRVASLKNFSWAGNNGAWAVQCIPHDGKFYMYCPVHMKGIGVLVADNPDGPFTDPIKKPLLNNTSNDIDPTAFIDDDGQAYLYWGNPTCTYVKLNKDMTSYSGSRVALNMTIESFGARTKTDRATSYEEGPWLCKRNSLYYLVFAGGPISEHIAYSTSSSPTGPWKYRGVIMPTQSGAAFTNHSGIAEFKGNSYMFYHDQTLSNNGFKRSVSLEKFSYNADGTIPKITATKEGVPQVGVLNPYDTVQAETVCWESGVEMNSCNEGIQVDSINNNDYIKVKGVDFGDGAKSFEARVASGANGKIELHLDSQTGKLIGTCDVAGTGGWDKWVTKTCDISGATGKHDLFLKFTGGSGFLFNFNWWRFIPIQTGIESGIKKGAQLQSSITISTNKKTVTFKPGLSSGSQQNATIKLYSLSGSLVSSLFQGKLGQSELTMDLKTIPSGTYLVKLQAGKTVMTKEISLQ